MRYEDFVEKFKPKKTTDDCYTPSAVYDAVRQWVIDKYNLQSCEIVRPFYPGGDYENYQYSPDCVVIDNPPFSIFSKICKFYLDRDIKFFLFAPHLTIFNSKETCMRMNHIICGANIIYENGAQVNTSFVTNLGDLEVIAQTEPELTEIIKQANRQQSKMLPRYRYPDNILTASRLERYGNRGIKIKIKRNECVRISKLDAQKQHKKAIFGSGLLLCSDATSRLGNLCELPETDADIYWELSERELAIIKELDKKINEGRCYGKKTF